MTTRRWVSVVVAGALLAACGGGSDGSVPEPVALEPAAADAAGLPVTC